MSVSVLTTEEWEKHRLKELRVKCTEALLLDRGGVLFYGCYGDDQEQYVRNREMYAQLIVTCADSVARALLKAEKET